MTGTNQEKITIATLNTRVTGVEKAIENLADAFNSLRKEISSLAQNAAKTNWSVIGAWGAVAVAIVTGLYIIVSMQSQLIVGPVTTRTELSEIDRAIIHKALDKLASETSSLTTAVAVLKQANVEVETQVRCLDALRNQAFQFQQQMNTIIASGVRIPVLPTIQIVQVCGADHTTR